MIADVRSLRTPMTSADVAERLGVTLDTFYRTRQRRHDQDQMPRPLSAFGRPKWDRATMEAWLGRNDPRRPATAANDPLPLPPPQTIEEHRALFAKAYGAPVRG